MDAHSLKSLGDSRSTVMTDNDNPHALQIAHQLVEDLELLVGGERVEVYQGMISDGSQ